jgi:hypothetical protein
VAGGRSVHSACAVQPLSEPVYDVLNCGPRRRFVVRGNSEPFIVHNCVQATARDLLAAALLRCAARGWRIVFHCHDEVVIEVPEGTVTPEEVLTCMLEPPPWAGGLPLAGSVHAGKLYFEEPDPSEAAQPTAVADVEQEIEKLIVTASPLPETRETERDAEKDFLGNLDGLEELDGLGATMAPLPSS